jgi:RecA/RadA recombinase
MAHHYHFLGGSGVGKTTHAKHLVNSAIHRGEGLLFLDPHGDDATDLLDTFPQKRRPDTILFDPSDFPIKWNPLDVDPSYYSLIAKAFVAVNRSLAKMPDAATANMDMTVHASILALLEYGGTLTDIPPLLTQKDIRDTITDSMSNRAGKEHWSFMDSLKDRDRWELFKSTYNKFYQLRADDVLNRVFDVQKTKLDVFDVVLNNKILIVRLPTGKLGIENVKLLGNMVLALTQVAAMSRTTTTPFWVFVDECHTFAPDILQEMLTGIRKFHVKLVCVNQFTTQLTPELFDALKGNAESHVFRVSEDDARRYQKWFTPNAMAENLEDLPDFTYRKFPWRKGDADVSVEPFEPERYGRSRTDIEERMRTEMM